jgi:hypothetical protein
MPPPEVIEGPPGSLIPPGFDLGAILPPSTDRDDLLAIRNRLATPTVGAPSSRRVLLLFIAMAVAVVALTLLVGRR